MRKIVIILIYSVNIFAFDIKTASLIFEKIFLALSHQDTAYVYSSNREYQKVIDESSLLYLDQNANFVFVTKKSEIPTDKKKILFTTDPEILKVYKNVVGAFYWERGHPKIIFIRSRLQDANLKLDSKFNKYMVDKI